LAEASETRTEKYMRRSAFAFAYVGFVTLLVLIFGSALVIFALWLIGRTFHAPPSGD
jgi:hypothetical protein